MKDPIVRLDKIEMTEWNGSEDGNTDFIAVFASGRLETFTAHTPRDLVRLMETTYQDRLSILTQGILIVRRLDEGCIWDAVNRWASFEERKKAWESATEEEDN